MGERVRDDSRESEQKEGSAWEHIFYIIGLVVVVGAIWGYFRFG
jgi:hypothetical protein